MVSDNTTRHYQYRHSMSTSFPDTVVSNTRPAKRGRHRKPRKSVRTPIMGTGLAAAAMLGMLFTAGQASAQPTKPGAPVKLTAYSTSSQHEKCERRHHGPHRRRHCSHHKNGSPATSAAPKTTPSASHASSKPSSTDTDDTSRSSAGSSSATSKSSTGVSNGASASSTGSSARLIAVSTAQAGGNVSSWIQQAFAILEAHGYSASQLNAADVAAIIQHESAGNPQAINLSDSNAAKGTPSKGLMQTIDPTFNAYALPGYSSIYNPVDNIVAGVRYAIATYGSLAQVPGVRSMSAGGGYVGY